MNAAFFWFTWLCGASFTFGYSRTPNKGYAEYAICLIVWPLILGDLMGRKL